MKLCVFQGTFNPIHNAHLGVCEYIVKNLNFDKVLLIPAQNPPHKALESSLATHRLEMVKLAASEHDYLGVSDIEYRRNTPSYTYETIKQLYNDYEIDGKINFIIGTDAFSKIESWYEADKLKELVDFLLFLRDNEYDSESFENLRAKGYNFRLMKMPFNDISSTRIRNLAANSKPISNIVPKSIEEYIKKHGLYRIHKI